MTDLITTQHLAAAPLPRRRTVPRLPDGWMILGVLWGFSLMWALGMTNMIWTAIALPMAVELMMRRKVRMPPLSGLWLIFLALLMPSVVMVLGSTSGLVWGFRVATYAAGGVIFVYAFNLDPVRFSTRRLVNAFAAYWGTIVIFGVVALIKPDISFPSGLELLLPRGLATQPFVAQLIPARVSQVHDFIGFAVARPAAPFVYTNNWGANLALASAPFVVWATTRGRLRRPVALTAVAIASVPIVLSLNRGLWLSLSLGIVYAAMRQAARTDVRQLVGLLAAGAFVGLLVVATPLGELVALRAEAGHSDDRRLELYTASVEATLDHPIVGNGGPVAIDELPDDAPPAGTHGQIWLLLVSHGIPATVAFLAFMGMVLLRTWRAPSDSFAFWTNVMFVMALSQMAVYALIPSQLPVLMLAAGVALRDLEVRQPAQARELTTA